MATRTWPWQPIVGCEVIKTASLSRRAARRLRDLLAGRYCTDGPGQRAEDAAGLHVPPGQWAGGDLDDVAFFQQIILREIPGLEDVFEIDHRRAPFSAVFLGRAAHPHLLRPG